MSAEPSSILPLIFERRTNFSDASKFPERRTPKMIELDTGGGVIRVKEDFDAEAVARLVSVLWRVALKYPQKWNAPEWLKDFIVRCVTPPSGCESRPATCACLKPCRKELGIGDYTQCRENARDADPRAGELLCSDSGG